MDRELYFISMAAEMLGMHPQTLRKYERLGLIQPSRTIGSMRLYSREELERLRLIKHLVDEAGINLAGVQRLLSIAEVMQRIRPLMDESALSTGVGPPAASERDPAAERSARTVSMRRALVVLVDVGRSFVCRDPRPETQTPALTMEFKDYYATLGVSKASTEKEIKQAYRKLARKLHPDVNPGDKQAEMRFKDINEAYEVLGDPEKRKKYDELGANWRQYEQAEAHGGPNPFAGRWNVNVGGGGGTSGFRTMTQEEMEELFGDSNPFSDFFTTFFGGGPADDRAGEVAPAARDATSSTRSS